MAKSKNHTNHQNDIKKPKVRHESTLGTDPNFLRRQRFCKKGNVKTAKQTARSAERKATREAKAKK